MQIKTVEEVGLKLAELNHKFYLGGEISSSEYVYTFTEIMTQDRAEIATALIEALEGKKVVVPEATREWRNAIEIAEKNGYNHALTEAQGIISTLLEGKN